jgi:hypothetical protein
MKHSLHALALAVFSMGIAQAQTAAPAPAPVAVADLSARASFSWSSKNVARGKERSSDEGLLQSQVTLEYSVPSFQGVSVYASVYGADNFERTYTVGGRTDSSVGTFDLGYQHSTATKSATLSGEGFIQALSDQEYYVGVVANKDVALRPSLYVYYSTELKQTNVVISGRKDFVGGEIGLPGFDLSTKVYAGSINSSASAYQLNTDNAYLYVGASVDLTRTIGAGAIVGLGGHYAYNTDGQSKTSGSTTWYKAYANFRF